MSWIDQATTSHIESLMQIIRLMGPSAEVLRALDEMDSKILKNWEVFDRNSPDWPKDIRAYAFTAYEAECFCRNYFPDGAVLEAKRARVPS